MSTLPVQNAFHISATKAAEISMKGTLNAPSSNYVLNYDDAVFPLSESEAADEKKVFIAEYRIDITNDVTNFFLKVVFHVLFRCEKDVTEEFINSPLIQINARAIGFPFVRSFITTLTANAGMNPIILPAINFAKRTEEQALQKGTP